MRRVLEVWKNLVHLHAAGQSPEKPKSQLSNSEYHLKPGEMNRIINAARSSRDRTLLRLLAETGLRRREAVQLQVSDVNWAGRLLVVRRGKGNKLRSVPLTNDLLQDFKELAGERRAGFVFVSQRQAPVSVRQVNRIVAQAGERARVSNPNPRYQHVTPHLLRHSFARLWKDRGGSIEALSKILGHQSVKTTWDLYGTMSLLDVQREYLRVVKSHDVNKEHDEFNKSSIIRKE